MTIEQAVTRVKEDGWTVVPGIIPDGEVAGVRESVLATIKESESWSPEGKRRVLGSFFTVNQSLAPYVSDRRIVGVAEALWGRHVKITVSTPVVRLPGSNPQGWHSDWPFNQKHAAIIEAPYPDTPMLLTVIFMLSPFTSENGGTWLVPGSHRIPNNWTQVYGEDNLSAHPSRIQATGDQGSVLIFDSRMWHAVPTNGTNEVRAGLTVRYAPWWLNVNVLVPGTPEREDMVDDDGEPERNLVFPMSQDEYNTLPEAAKPLLHHWVR